jgi:hypothetical protein
MSLHYQVFANFQLTQGKPQLLSTSIFSTTAPCATIPLFENSVLSNYRIFQTLQMAKDYIAYLHKVYPDSPAKPPLLDGGQKKLFKGGLKRNKKK